jgi:hypothetical protein
MKIQEFCDIIDGELHVYYSGSAVGPLVSSIKTKSGAHIDYKESEDDCFLTGVGGNGRTPHESINNLINKLKDYKIAVIHTLPKRFTVRLPRFEEYNGNLP